MRDRLEDLRLIGQGVALIRRCGKPRWPLLNTHYAGVRPISTRNLRLVTRFLPLLTQQTHEAIYIIMYIYSVVHSSTKEKTPWIILVKLILSTYFPIYK